VPSLAVRVLSVAQTVILIERPSNHLMKANIVWLNKIATRQASSQLSKKVLTTDQLVIAPDDSIPLLNKAMCATGKV
jgi:hypothetical protein